MRIGAGGELMTIEITNSERKSFSCRQRWLWRSLMRFREAKTGRALYVGTMIDRALDAYWLAGGGYDGVGAAHKAIDLIAAERSTAVEKLAADFTAQSQLASTSAPDAKTGAYAEAVASAKATLRAYHEHWARAGRDWELVSKARTIRSTPGTTALAGEVDMIVFDRKSGRRLLVDHKTTRRPLSQWIPENTISPQMATYGGILSDLGEPVDGYVFDVISIRNVVDFAGLPRNKNGMVRSYSGARPPSCTSYTWREYIAEVSEAAEAKGEPVDPVLADKLADVLAALEKREAEGYYFSEVVDTISAAEIVRTRIEMENIADEMGFLKAIAAPWIEKVDAAAKDGTLWLATQSAHAELAPAFPRNHSECFNWSRACEYMGLCRYGQAGDRKFYRPETSSPELTPEDSDDE